jgi:NAD(P)H-dependent flavin oxidoreductase YrpB (nitropropane dioxygenase family)/DNA-binding MarR family transcriptional regulator
LSISEIHVIAEIGVGRAKTMTEIATGLRISLGALTTAVNKLVKKGYAERLGVPEDRRVVKVRLTESGEKAVMEHERFHERLVESVVSRLNEKQRDDLQEMMENIYDFLNAQTVRPLEQERDHALKPIRVGGMVVERPIFQGDMGPAFSSPALAAAIATQGGVGLISSAAPGFAEDDYGSNRREANLRAFKRHIEEALRKAGRANGAIAASVLCSDNSLEDMVKTAVEARAPLLIAGAGIPLALPGIVAGADVKLAPIVSSARAVAVIKRNWLRKWNRVPDAVIFESTGKSGHLGFKEEQLGRAEEDFYRTIAEIKKEMSDIPDCPLIVANGPMNREDVRRTASFGADGIQLEEEFALAKECDATEGVKRIYRRESKGTALVDSPLGMPARIFRNSLAVNIARGRATPKKCDQCLHSCAEKASAFCLMEALVAAAVGDAQNGILFRASKAVCRKSALSRPDVSVKDIFDYFFGTQA